MISLINVQRDMTKYIAKYGTHRCQLDDCEKCIIGRFNNEDISCQQIAKELLQLLASQEKENE